MATAASSPLASSVEKTNGAKLSKLLIDGGTTVLRKIFDSHHPPAKLVTDLNANYSILNNLLRRRVLNGHQWGKLFPPGGVVPDSKTFDITLLFLLLTNICGLTPPPSGWHTKPPPSDTSHEANLARVKFSRNVLYGHVTTTGVDTPTFSTLWAEISGVLVSLGLDRAEVDRLKAEKGGEQDYIDVLIEWADSEEDIKSQLKNIKQAVEGLSQVQAKTQDTLEEVLQAQTKTQRAVGDVGRAVKRLKEERDKDRTAEVLQKLVKSEFRGDIEYYLERFPEGTREWVFNRVQNWLDDRSSQNRVMVITGNAGMGKSVISAVICKRMQEASRLSGSHFCQYNNVRYCKPQLMIQSLACHLSHALEEYKQALVEQLSRNLGTDLNNMGVEELFALLFKEPLSAVGDPGKNMLMVIDGLDESEYQGRNELLDVIANQFCKLPFWIRFFATTRPALNIAENLKHLNPLELKCNDEKNLEDVRMFFQNNLEHMVKLGNVGEFVERLVLRSEGLMLYAHFLILSITENASIFQEGGLVGSLPLGMSAVYHSYFKRLERELLKELDIKEEHFLNLLSAITASREPLPVGFASTLLVSSSNSPLARRKVLSALSSVSALLPIRDDCVHVIHKSVKDWLTGTPCYKKHEFIMDENEGHRILAALCTNVLYDLKLKGVDNVQFGATERYALYHGARHMLHEDVKREPHKLDKLTKVYIRDLEIVYAKICVNSTIAAEDILWLKNQGIFTLLSKDNQIILDTLLFLLRKYLRRFSDTPRAFLQTILNQGGKVLTVEASNLLRKKYPEIPYMEVVHKGTPQGGVVARFECSSVVVCLDVSPRLDYMVCECIDGVLQLWSLHTGGLVWTRPAIVKQCYNRELFLPLRKLPSAEFVSLFRSVVFHPTRDCVLPGILCQAYTLDGDLKPLFPGSNCSFSVCSISGDKTKILTNCLGSSNCLVLWSLENGSEVDRIIEDEDILSFAWSSDGRLLAITHFSGVISLVDVVCGFRNLAQIATRDVFGIIRFSPDHRFLFCRNVEDEAFFLRVVKDTYNSFSLEVPCIVSNDFENRASFNDCGFSFGDIVTTDQFFLLLTFILDEQRLLRCKSRSTIIEMVDTKQLNKSVQSESSKATGIALSLDGQTVYVASDTSVTAYDVFSGMVKAEINRTVTKFSPLRPVIGGVVILTTEGALELWGHNLFKCVNMWSNLPGVKQLIPMSEARVAVVREREVNILDTNSGGCVSIIPVLQGRALTCNSKCQLLTVSTLVHPLLYFPPPCSLQLLDGTTVVWKRDGTDFEMVFLDRGVRFSPSEQVLVVTTFSSLLVLDAKTGNTVRTLRSFPCINHRAFISDDEYVISTDLTVHLLNVKSGELLSATDVESRVTCLAACPFNRVLVIGLEKSTPNFKVIRACLPQGEDIENGKRPCSATLKELER